MVPVGGAIVAGFDEKFIDAVSKTYPGEYMVPFAPGFPLLPLRLVYLCLFSYYFLLLLTPSQMPFYPLPSPFSSSSHPPLSLCLSPFLPVPPPPHTHTHLLLLPFQYLPIPTPSPSLPTLFVLPQIPVLNSFTKIQNTKFATVSK